METFNPQFGGQIGGLIFFHLVDISVTAIEGGSSNLMEALWTGLSFEDGLTGDEESKRSYRKGGSDAFQDYCGP